MSLSFEERKKLILEYLEREEKIQVRVVAKILDVSGETIRRDLDRLEKEGILKKVYGGAVKAKNSIELPFDQKTTMNALEKRAICKAAAGLVEDGDVIMIGHGTTAFEIVRFLNDKKNVTVITPSVPVLLLAMEVFDGQIIFIGGEYEREQKFTSGPLAEMIVSKLRANKAFVAAGGLSINDGITDYDLHGSSSSRKLMQRAEDVIVLADHTKFGKSTFAHVSSLTDASMIITDKPCSNEWEKTLAENEIELLIADDL